MLVSVHQLLQMVSFKWFPVKEKIMADSMVDM